MQDNNLTSNEGVPDLILAESSPSSHTEQKENSASSVSMNKDSSSNSGPSVSDDIKSYDMDNVSFTFIAPTIQDKSRERTANSSNKRSSRSISGDDYGITITPVTQNPLADDMKYMLQADSDIEDSQANRYPTPPLDEDDGSCGVNLIKKSAKFLLNLSHSFAPVLWFPFSIIPAAYQATAEILITPLMSNLDDLLNHFIYRTHPIAGIKTSQMTINITIRTISLSLVGISGTIIGNYGPNLGAPLLESENNAVQFIGLLLTDPNFRKPFLYTLGYFGNVAVQKTALALWERYQPQEVVDEDPQQLNSVQHLIRYATRAGTSVTVMKGINLVDSYHTSETYSVYLVTGTILAIDIAVKSLAFFGLYEESAEKLKLPESAEEQFKAIIPENKSALKDKKGYDTLQELTEIEDTTEEQTHYELIMHGAVVRLGKNAFLYGAGFAWAMAINGTYENLHRDNPESFFGLSYVVTVGAEYLLSNIGVIKDDIKTVGKHLLKTKVGDYLQSNLSSCCSSFFSRSRSGSEVTPLKFNDSNGRQRTFSSMSPFGFKRN